MWRLLAKQAGEAAGVAGATGVLRRPDKAEQGAGRSERVDKYFRRPPDPKLRVRGLGVLTGGILGVLVGLLLGMLDNPVAGIIPVILGGYAVFHGGKILYRYQRAFRNAAPKPSDAEMDELLAEDRAHIVECALAALGITRGNLYGSHPHPGPAGFPPAPGRLSVKDPLVVVSPTFAPPYGVGADRVLRFSSYQMVVICPTAHLLGVYRCELDFRTGLLPHEKTSEHPYHDVVEISAETRSALGAGLFADDNFKIPSLEHNFMIPSLDPAGDEYVVIQKPVVKMFQISMSGGDREEFLVGLTDAQNPNRSARLRDAGVDDVLACMRQVLQGVKSGALGVPGPWPAPGYAPGLPYGPPAPAGTWQQYGPPPQHGGWPPYGPPPPHQGGWPPYGPPPPYGPHGYGPPQAPHGRQQPEMWQAPHGRQQPEMWQQYEPPPQGWWPPSGPQPPDVWQPGPTQRRSLPGNGSRPYHPGRDEPPLELDDDPPTDALEI